jgi:hypothetical protein
MRKNDARVADVIHLVRDYCKRHTLQGKITRREVEGGVELVVFMTEATGTAPPS